MLGLSPWVPVQGPSYSTGFPLDKKNETVFLSELSATDGTTYDYAPDDAFVKLNAMLRAVRPVRPLLAQEFYALTDWSIEEDGWLAYQHCRWDASVAPSTQTGSVLCIVQAFRRVRSTEAVDTFRLYGLHPEATYTVEDWLSRSPPQQQRGSELMGAGLQIELAERPSATLLFVRLASTPVLKVDDEAGVVNEILFARNTSSRHVTPENNATCYRIPAIVFAPPAVLAFAEARKGATLDGKPFDLCFDGSKKSIAYRRSTDSASTWSPILTVAGTEGDGWVVGNPTAVYDAETRTVLLHVQNNSNVTSVKNGIGWMPGQTWQITSTIRA